MVAVAHGEKEAVAALVKGFQGLSQGGHILGIGHSPAPDMAASRHQIEVVQFFQRIPALIDGLDEGALRIVGQQHYVAQLQGCAPADIHAGREPLYHSALGAANQGLGAWGIVVHLQVDGGHQAQADASGSLPFYQHKALYRPGEELLLVLGHALVYGRDIRAALM